MYTHEEEPHFWERNKIILKGLLVAVLILIMLIPGKFVNDLVLERQARQQDVVNEVSSKWARGQTITGPVLLLPYKISQHTIDGRIETTLHTAYILPDELHINGNMQPTEKTRSLYSVMLYSSSIRLEGKFNNIPLDGLQIPATDILWQDARLVLTVGDMRGITDEVALNWNGSKQSLEAGVPQNQLVKEGISAPVTVNATTPSSFSIDLKLKGSEQLYFTPVGKSTTAGLSSTWHSPAFDGQYLPDTSSISNGRFTATWKILPLSHNYPQYWKDMTQDLNKAAFGVKLIQPHDGYSKTNRSVKYAILFIALTFTFFFFLEILLKKPIHALQYILVGIALTIFYTLLLSISEYAGFNIAYFIAAAATVGLISMYTWSVFKSGKTAIGFTVALSGLYGYIFILIQLEDYALLFGSIGLFFILAVIMYYSRKIDWHYASTSKKIQPDEEKHL